MRTFLLEYQSFLPAVRTFLLRYLRTVLDILFEGACHTASPVTYGFAVEAQTVDKVDNIYYRHTVTPDT